ncbi:MAG: hypothetical protein R2729_01930 [Bryobacteraceae bacterium]
MQDYTYPSVYFAYLFFFLLFGLAVYFFVRTWRHGYFGPDSEEVKFRMLREDSD